jgi:photosystem II stability/assembly factor-like uncharacterized protein
MYISTDNGNNWQKRYKIPYSVSPLSSPNSISIFKNHIFVGTTGTTGVLYCQLSSDSLIQYTPAIDFPSITNLIAREGILYASAEAGGIYMLENVGEQWQHRSKGINAIRVNSLIVSNNRLLASTQSNGIYYSEDGGKSWNISRESTRLITGGANAGIYESSNSFLLFNDTLLCLADLSQSIIMSSDNGITWTSIKDDYYYNSIRTWIWTGTQLILGEEHSFNQSQHMNLQYSHDYGKTFIPGDSMFIGKNINCFAKRNDTLLASNYSTGMYRSTDNGLKWTRVSDHPFAIAMIFSNNQVIVASQQIYRSSDYCSTWDTVCSLGEDGRVSQLIESGDTIFASTRKGVLYSTDEGQNWNNFGTSINTFQVQAMTSHFGKYFAATSTHSIYSYDGTTNYSTSNLSRRRLTGLQTKAIYRNGKLIFNTSAISQVEIYTATGRLVFKQAQQPADRQHIDLKGIPAGQYVLKYKTNNRCMYQSFICIE